MRRTEASNPRPSLAWYPVSLVGAAFVVTSSPVIYRDRPELLPWTLGPLALLILFAARWRMRMTTGMALFAAWAALSSLWTSDSVGTAIDVATLILTVIISSAVVTFGAAVVARGLFFGAAFAVTASLAVGVALPAYGRSVAFGGAFTGIYAHRNFLAAVAVLGVALTIASLLNARTPLARSGYLVTLGLFAAASMLTLSGSAIVISVTVVVGAALLWGFRRMGPLARYGLTPILLVLIGGFLIPWTARAVPQLTQLIGRDATLTGRVDIWNIVLSASSERPLSGYGWGGVWRGDLGDSIRATFGWNTANSAHNGFLDALLQVGWIGAVLLASIALIALVRALRLAVRSPGLSWMPLVLSAVIVNSVTESQATRPIGVFVIALVGSLAWMELKRGSDYGSRPTRSAVTGTATKATTTMRPTAAARTAG